MSKSPTTKAGSLLSMHQIAMKINRSHPAVKAVIKRIKLKPAIKTGRVVLFYEDDIQTIQDNMRSPNKS